MSHLIRPLIVLTLALAIAGCATAPPPVEPDLTPPPRKAFDAQTQLESKRVR